MHINAALLCTAMRPGCARPLSWCTSTENRLLYSPRLSPSFFVHCLCLHVCTYEIGMSNDVLCITMGVVGDPVKLYCVSFTMHPTLYVWMLGNKKYLAMFRKNTRQTNYTWWKVSILCKLAILGKTSWHVAIAHVNKDVVTVSICWVPANWHIAKL
jgi:hypothetical protein